MRDREKVDPDGWVAGEELRVEGEETIIIYMRKSQVLMKVVKGNVCENNSLIFRTVCNYLLKTK